MSAAREEVLRRIRSAIAGQPVVEVPRGYRMRGALAADEVVALFVERVRDYRAEVVVTDAPASAAAAALVRHGARRVGVPPDLAAELRPPGFELVEDRGLSAGELDRLDGALTTAAAACAETGSIAFDGGPGTGRRAVTLVPDLHVCVVRSEQVVETVPELIARLEPSAREGRPLVIVSGPSATSDIELQRVEGVHGPRRLVVVVAIRSGV